jgi:hypothetical protein
LIIIDADITPLLILPLPYWFIAIIIIDIIIDDIDCWYYYW